MVGISEDLFSAATVHVENQLCTFSESLTQDWVLQISFGLVERVNGKLLRHGAVTKTGDLRKDKPDPMAGLSPGPQLIKDGGIDALLRVEKAVKIVLIGHELCPPTPFSLVSPRDVQGF